MSLRLVLTVLLSIAVLAVFVSLGVWQLQRLQWKQGVLHDIAARIGAPPVALPVAPEPASDKFLPITADGQMSDDELHVLVSTRDAGAGFRIIAGFDTGGRRIMVDRGFVPITAKNAPRQVGTMRVTGNLHWPEERDKYTPANDPKTNYWYAREVEVMAAALGAEPVLLVARSPTDPGVTPLPVSNEGVPNDHLEYAFTWFLLAATWVVMTGYALWRMKRQRP